MKRLSLPLFFVLIVVGCLVYASTSVVRFNELAVRSKFGKASPESVITKPGWYLKWPAPIETIKKYDARLRTTDTPESEIKTLDGKNLIVSAFALWRIEDAYKYFVRVVDDKEAEKQLRTRLGQVRSAMIGKREMGDFINLDQNVVQQNWSQLETDILEAAAPGILQDYGIELVSVGIRRISLPESVTQSVFQSMVQTANNLAQRYQKEGESEATAITSRAQADQRQILAFAATKADAIRSEGRRASNRILEGLENSDREFYEFQQLLNTLRIALSQRTTFFLDANSPLFKPLVDPLTPSNQSAVPAAPTTTNRQDEE
ncbi:MAG: protease modulator HflC [Phycisphaerae bacterium]